MAGKRQMVCRSEDRCQTIARSRPSCRTGEKNCMIRVCAAAQYVIQFFPAYHALVRNVYNRLKKEDTAMTYMTVQQAAEAWGLSVRQVQVYCNRGRVQGHRSSG